MADITIEELAKRVTNLERNFSAFININNINKSYTDAAINGVSVSVSNVTPYTETKQAYIGDEMVVFNTSVGGNISVFAVDENGNMPSFSVKKGSNYIEVVFDNPLEYVTTVTLSVQEE
jgi:hypothetical protein